MDLMVQLEKLFSSKRGYSHWFHLLQFFEQHKDELSKEAKRQIYNKVEYYRRKHNKEAKNEADQIRREHITPNIYTDLSFLKDE